MNWQNEVHNNNNSSKMNLIYVKLSSINTLKRMIGGSNFTNRSVEGQKHMSLFIYLIFNFISTMPQLDFRHNFKENTINEAN